MNKVVGLIHELISITLTPLILALGFISIVTEVLAKVVLMTTVWGSAKWKG